MDELFFWLGWLGQQVRYYFLAIPFLKIRKTKLPPSAISAYEDASSEASFNQEGVL
jgi:hypothetical protein